MNRKTGKAPSPYGDFTGQYIGGTWRPGRQGDIHKDLDPFTGETLLEIVRADKSDLDQAYQAAAKAQPAWAARLPTERSAVLRKAAEVMEARRSEIEEWIVRETGGTRIKAHLEWELVHAGMLEASSYPYRMEGRILPIDVVGKESRAYRRPLGVIGVISPWNFPLQLSHRSVGPALALGNGVVLKPAEDTPVTGGLLLAKIFEDAGLPPGVLNVVIGSSREIGDDFCQHPIPRLISFTGSTKVGRRVAELAATGPMLKHVSLELGGNGPCVVLDDADLDQAVRGAVFGRFVHQGQVCMSTNRIIIDAAVHDEFVERFTDHARRLTCGDPKDPATAIGPVINQHQLDGMLEHIRNARTAGARHLLGGDPQGLVLPPQVFDRVTNDMEIAQAELFGPIAPIIRVHGEEEALRVANDTEYGLASAVYTRDEARGLRFALGLQVGMTHINDVSVEDMPNNPFGGEKNSGLGRFGGDWVVDEFTTDHWVTVQRAPREYPF